MLKNILQDTNIYESFDITKISAEKMKKIKKLYKIQEAEISASLKLEDAIINRISTKHCL